jgi:hypothetical protein
MTIVHIACILVLGENAVFTDLEQAMTQFPEPI